MKRKKLIYILSGVILTILLLLIIFIPLFFENEENEELNRIQFIIGGEKVDDFGYWLQDMDIDEIKNSKYDLLILDYSLDGNISGEFTKSQIATMKSSNDKEKLLLSYISIGEAENYRFYWNSSWDADENGIPDVNAPDWLDKENSEWSGNYKVKFWKSGWREIIYDYLDKIIEQGFNGIYMDIIDAYEYYEGSVPHSDWLMINLVGNISSYVQTNAGLEFVVLVQNGDNLLKNFTYLSFIDGIGREDLFYDDDKDTDKEWREEGIQNLNIALDNDKAVFVIDYPQEKDNIYDFYSLSIENDFLPYATERELDSLKEFEFYPAT